MKVLRNSLSLSSSFLEEYPIGSLVDNKFHGQEGRIVAHGTDCRNLFGKGSYPVCKECPTNGAFLILSTSDRWCWSLFK